MWSVSFQRARVGAVTGVVIAVLAACGGSSGNDPADSGPVLLEPADVLVLEERLGEVAQQVMRDTGSVGGGGFGYTNVDRVVDGFVLEDQDPVERCQQAADGVADLDGPAATVPIRIIRYIPDGGGEYEVLATGAGGGTCTPGG